MTHPEKPPEVWRRLPSAEWNDQTAAHLLRRTTWSARPADVRRAREEGLERTLDRLFPSAPLEWPRPPGLDGFEEEWRELQGKIREASGVEKRYLQREQRERSQAALQELRIAWLQGAAKPENAALAKWGLFLGDVYVVSADKVRNASFLWKHQEIVAAHALGPAPALTKAVSRSPAMATYLDLARSGKKAPNENFARELFELFVLGEGSYTERDIKEAARAFTGYRVDPRTGGFRFAAGQHDRGRKTIFGKTGAFTGDEVIDLAYEEPAAAEFLPRELARFYLSETPLPPEHVAALGGWWRGAGFDLRKLARTFFGSRLFFAEEYRGNLIKSPVQFYLGLLQDLDLEVTPLPRYSTSRLRQMGQELFRPPNVRGWVGGRAWINSSTLAVRRQLVQQLFAPLREENLNADEQRILAEARARGVDRFTVSDRWWDEHVGGAPEKAARQLVDALLPAGGAAERVIRTVRDFLAEGSSGRRDERRRMAAIAILQTPEYQLC